MRLDKTTNDDSWLQRVILLLLVTIGGVLVPGACRYKPSLNDLENRFTMSQSEAGGVEDGLPTAGWLAYIGADGNVYVTEAEGAWTVQVTNDATTGPEGEGRSYHRISWSPDGRLAYAAVTRTNNMAHSQLYVGEPLVAEELRITNYELRSSPPASLVGESDGRFVIYIYWSPASCGGRPACWRLAYLIGEGDRVALRLVEMEADSIINRLLGLGQPFYFAWSPDGQHMVWHTGGSRRYNPEARLTLYDVAGDEMQKLPHAPGLFIAPVWSPEGDRWLSVTAGGESDQLQITQHPPLTTYHLPLTITVAAVPDGQLAFTWSPKGDRIAYAWQSRNFEAPFGPIYIFDLNTGQAERLTGMFGIEAFFWAPDGERLGYLTRQALWTQWRVYDFARHEDRGFAMFQPSFQMRFITSSFNQFAQSHRFWSPDGRYLVYADRDAQLVERVWLIDTWAEKGTQSRFIAEGSIGVWSWD